MPLQVHACGRARPARFAPLLGRCPLSCVLAAYGLGGTTYAEVNVTLRSGVSRVTTKDDYFHTQRRDRRRDPLAL